MDNDVAQRLGQVLEPAIRQLQKEIFHRAEAIGEPYWREANDRREGEPKERARFALYVREGRAGVSITYKKLGFAKGKAKWYPRSQHVAIGKVGKRFKTKYDIAKFKRAPDWEIAMIKALEEKFEQLRKDSAYITRIAAAARTGGQADKTNAESQTDENAEPQAEENAA